MREIQYFLDLNGIKQIYISKGIIDNKDTILKEINYENYSNKFDPVLFWGMYNNADVETMNNHEGRVYIYWGGSDSNVKKLNIIESKWKNLNNCIIHLCKSDTVYKNLKSKFNNIINLNNIKNKNLEDDKDFLKKYNVHKINNVIYLESKKKPGFFAGMPNKDNKIYLYEGMAKWTEWKEDNNKNIKYCGYKFDKSELEIVISRYNEDLSWSDPFNDIRTIYNKGKDDLEMENIKLKNVGRESHTYLHHIISNYNNLSKKTLFIKPLHKNSDLNCIWLKFSHNLSNINQFINYSLDNDERNIYFPFLDVTDTESVSEGPDANGVWKPYFHPHGKGKVSYVKNTLDLDESGNLIHFGKWKKSRPPKFGNFVEYFKKYIDNSYDNYANYYLWSPHGIFTVEKDMIKNRSLESYKSILDTLTYADDVQEGHYIERSWYYMFQKYFKFSYGMSCRNRVEFLKKTLSKNLDSIKKYPNAILTLLNYNSEDYLNEYILNNFSNEEKLNYVIDTEAKEFNMSKTKNITSNSAPIDVDIVSWCDCDNFLNHLTIYHNNAVFNCIKNTAIFPDLGKDNNWDAGNRISVYKESMDNKIVNYNENFFGWGFDDIDFKLQCILNFNCNYQNNIFFIGDIPHEDNIRLKNYRSYNENKILEFKNKNNIPDNFYNKIVNIYGFYSRKTSELFNKYISIKNIKSYLNNISNDKYLITDRNEKHLIDNIACFHVNLNRHIIINISETKIIKFNLEISTNVEDLLS